MGQRRLNKQFTPDHEALACKFVDLAVDLRDAYASKDGLINFRYLTQQVRAKGLRTGAGRAPPGGTWRPGCLFRPAPFRALALSAPPRPLPSHSTTLHPWTASCAD